MILDRGEKMCALENIDMNLLIIIFLFIKNIHVNKNQMTSIKNFQ